MKKSLALFLVLVLTLSFAACGKTPPASSAVSTAVPSSASEAPAPSLSGEIRYVSMWNETEPQAEVIKAAIEDFTSLYPDVSIKVNWMGRDTLKTIVASLDAGQVDLWDQGINHVIVKYSDYGYEMTELFAQPNPILGGKAYNDFANPALVSAMKENAPDGKLYGVPYIPNVVAAFYNKAMFAEASITQEPQTWEELLTVCQKLKDVGITAFSVDDGYITLPFAMYLGRLKGVDFNKTLVSDKTGAAWDDPAVKQAAQAMQELWDKGYMSKNAASNKYPAGQNEVAMGDAAIYLVGSYMLNEVKEITGEGFEWGSFAFPSPEGSVLPTTANTFGMNVLQIAKNAQDPELAFYFASFLTTGKYDAMMSENCNAIPTAMDTPWPEVVAPAQSVLNASTQNIPYNFGIDANADFTPIYKEQAQKLLGGQIDASGFIAACKAAVTGK